MVPSRPGPAETATRRGRLKVFLGAAPGVGKTFEMLTGAHRRLAEGVDVLVGVVESHGRSDTARLIDGLAVLPPRTVEHRGRVLQEFDLDAALARRPGLLLVDELAHTNAPGARHAKRWQDVEELLDAGIDVWSTLNVQHLESVRGLVARIAGVEVREAVPDQVLALAQDVELIDLPPDDLLARLQQGKVYAPAQAARALERFFTRGTLLALRELALRAAANRVEDDLSAWSRLHAVEGPFPAAGRLLACIDAGPSADELVRVAARRARASGSPWTVLHVDSTARPMTDDERTELEAAFALAESLGATVAQVPGAAVGDEILAYARAHHVERILVMRGDGRAWWRRTLVDWLLRHAGSLEVSVLPPVATSAPGVAKSRLSLALPALPAPTAVLWAAAAVAAASAVAWLLDPWLDSAALGTVFLVAVVAAGSLRGAGAAFVAAGLGFVAYNFAFTEPRYTLAVQSPADFLALVTFLLAAAVVGLLAARLRRQADDARQAAARVEALFDFARRLATAVDERDLREAAARGVADLVGRPARLHETAADGTPLGATDLEEPERAAARWAAMHGEVAGARTATLAASHWTWWPVGTPDASGRRPGVLGIEGSRATSAAERRLIEAMTGQLAVSWERFRLLVSASREVATRDTQALRDAVLASLSHDLRTPLSAVVGSLSTLTTLGTQVSAADHAELVRTAEAEAQRLVRLVDGLLDVTRVAFGAVGAVGEPVDWPEMLREAARRAGLQQAPSITAGEAATVRADPRLLAQVFANLCENARKYAGAGVALVATASEAGEHVTLRLQDDGPGIPVADHEAVFSPLHRVRRRDRGVGGTGLGLPICRGFARAMGGDLRLVPVSTGTCFELRLPAVRR